MKMQHQSIGDMASTLLKGERSEVVGSQVGLLTDGLQPTYGMTASDMNVDTMIIDFTWSDLK